MGTVLYNHYKTLSGEHFVPSLLFVAKLIYERPLQKNVWLVNLGFSRSDYLIIWTHALILEGSSEMRYEGCVWMAPNHAAGRRATHAARRGSQMPPQFAAVLACIAAGIANRVPQHANCWASVLSAALAAWPQLWRQPNTREVNNRMVLVMWRVSAFLNFISSFIHHCLDMSYVSSNSTVILS
jgi:hypothetical protein